MTQEVLVKVVSRLFTSALTMLDDTCITTGPLLGWCKGKSAADLRSEFAIRKWTATVVKSPVDPRVVLTRTGLLTASAEELRQIKALFGEPIITSIMGGEAEPFEGEWHVKNG